MPLPGLDLSYSTLSVARESITNSRQIVHFPALGERKPAAGGLTSPHAEHTAHSPDGLWEVNFISDAGKARVLEVWTEGAKKREIEVGGTHGEWFFDREFLLL